MDNTSADKGIGKKCKNCGKTPKEGAIFGIRKTSAKDGKAIYEKLTCKDCEAATAKQRRLDNADKIAEIKQRYHEKHHGTIKHHVQEKIATWRKASNVPSDLTVEYLVGLFEKQDGLCFYSGEKMIFGWVDGKVHHNSLSLDKLDPIKGYVQGNVVWCTYLVNTMKQDMAEQRFYDTINNIFKNTYGVTMANEFTLKDKLCRIVLEARIGVELPKLIEREAVESAKQGKYSCKIMFTADTGTKPFYAALGPASLAWLKDMHQSDKRWNMGQEAYYDAIDVFTESLIKDLEAATSLKITLIPRPKVVDNGRSPTLHAENIGLYRYHELVIDVSWAP